MGFGSRGGGRWGGWGVTYSGAHGFKPEPPCRLGSAERKLGLWTARAHWG